MANPEHLEILGQGVAAWNKWRADNPGIKPDLSGANIRDIFEKKGYVTDDGRIDLAEVNFSKCDLQACILTRAMLFEARLDRAMAERVSLEGASITEGSLIFADFTEADFREATIVDSAIADTTFAGAKFGGARIMNSIALKSVFNVADFSGALLFRVDSSDAKFVATDFTDASIGLSILMGAEFLDAILLRTELRDNSLQNRNAAKPVPETDLTWSKGLTQSQIEQAFGSEKTGLPPELTRPAHWLDTPYDETDDLYRSNETARGPYLPPRTSIPRAQNVIIERDQITLSATPMPERDALIEIYADLRDDVEQLQNRLGNVSVDFDRFLARYADIIAAEFDDLGQIRFGVQTDALRSRFETERPTFEAAAPEDIGKIEAIIRAAELIAARLPQWQEFLAETRDDHAAIAANPAPVVEAITEATNAMAAAPEHFAPVVAETFAEYLDTKTIEAYVVATSTLNAVLFTIATEIRRFTRDTATQTRKTAIKALAGGITAALGASLGKLAGLMPAEFEWVVPWLKYIPTLL